VARRKKREPEVADIVSATHDGRGIAAVDGKKVFVAGALPGENVRFIRRKRRRNFDEAELLEVIQASPSRIEPRCEVFGACGGCSLQHQSVDDQRRLKQQTLADNLARIGEVEPAQWLAPVIAGEAGEWNYRRRARLAVKDVAGKNRVLVGFREAHAPFVCDMHRCEVLAEPVASLLDPLSELIASLSIRQRCPQIEVAIGDNVTTLIFRMLDPPNDDDEKALAAFAAAHDLQVCIQSGGLDSVRPVAGSELDTLHYALSEFDVTIQFEPTDFVQINAEVNRAMVSAAIAQLQIEPSHRVLDLFCGIGNFSLPIARHAGHVLGIEGEQRQVERARANAKRNGLDNCEFEVLDLALEQDVAGSGRRHAWYEREWDRILIDPARSGAAEVVVKLSASSVPRVVYVSCHPGTLARDAKTLVQAGGYKLESAGIIDMFPHTAHVESMAVFSS